MGNQSGFQAIHLAILKVLREHPEGLDIHEIRAALGNIEGQQHLDRRVRQLRSHYKVPYRAGRYHFEGDLDATTDNAPISAKLRAAVMHAAGGRCQMCGKTVKEDGVKLQADHKIPRTWDGETTLDNLWALCELCNGGKRNYFSSFPAEEMRKLAKMESVYERLTYMLKANTGKAVPSWLLEFVANLNDFQEDWQKRLRELRYPVIGMEISSGRTKSESGKWIASYKLEKWAPLPRDHKKLIKDYEKKLRQKRQARPPARS
jgi:5-methylcytosine-specific restriction endonuclease McrA